MKKKLIPLLFVILCVFSLSAASASDEIIQDNITLPADGEIVSDDAGESELIENDDSEDFRRVQEQIDLAEAGDTVYLDGSTYYCDALINIDKTLTIDGRGSTLIFDGTDKDYKSSFFHVEKHASDVVLRNLTFVDGKLFFGGAVTWEGDNGIISDCEFKSNLAFGEYGIGGALLILGNNCSVVNSTFVKNHADKYGGAVLWNGTNGLIDNCKFIGNEATDEEDGRGGALILIGDNCTVMNSDFINNSCTFMGGAVFVSESANSTIVNCNFNGNYIQKEEFESDDDAGGAAIFTACNALTIDKCNFTNNHVNSTAGALHLSVNDTVVNSFFNKNYAMKDDDGYEYANDIAYFGNSEIYKDNIRSNTFILDFGEYEYYSVGVNYPELLDIIMANNTFIKTKLNSTISFSAGIIFDYGATSSPIQIVVVGGQVEQKNIEVLNHSEAVINFSNNTLSVSNLPVGKHTLVVTTTPDEGYNEASNNLSIVVNKATAVLSASSFSVVLKKSTYWDIKLVDGKSGDSIKNMKLTLKVYTGKKYKTMTVRTDSKGVAHFKTSSLAKGKHKIVVSGSHAGYKFNTLTKYITVVKPTPLKFKVYKRKDDKSGSLISFQVINKNTKKPVNNIQVTFLVKTGSKYKKFLVLKTKTVKDKNGKKIKGITGFFTNKLTVGKHLVKIQPVSIKYSGSGNSYIIIKKTAKSKKYPQKTTKV